MQIHKLAVVAVTAAALLVPTAATAAGLSGPYFGGSYGQYKFKDNNLNENDTLWKAFVGGQFNNWLGVEAGYVAMDRAANQGSSFEAEGFTAAALLSFPLAQKSSFYVKGGGFWWDAERRGSVNTDRSHGDPFYGAGFRIGLSEHFSLRLEYERYEVVDTDIDTASIGLQANF
jgi:OmpA-OmpF porin, OOP family